jgi:tetratricopeptide (TPR) repeat protein
VTRLAADPELELARMRAAARLFPGDGQLGSPRYRVLECIGRGAMGVVYAAYDSQLERRVALKLVGISGERMDRNAQRRLVREAQALARLSHPNVVVVHDAGALAELGLVGDASAAPDFGAFVAMEFVTGESLRRWMAEHRRDWREVLAAVGQAGRGLAAVHRAGLVHRDIKPDNLMIDGDGRVRVMDFGLARTDDRTTDRDRSTDPDAPAHDLDPDAEERSRSSATAGTPAYMAPELLEGGVADALSDQYAFAATVWEALYGERPFTATSVASLLSRIPSGPRIPAGSRVPGWLHAVVLRGLAPEPAQRWRSIDAMLTALQADPSRRRRRIAVAALAISTLFAIGGAVQLERAHRRDACVEAGMAIGELWNADVRARLLSSVDGDVPGYAAFARARVLPWVDEYAAAWQATRESTCLAAALGGRDGELARRSDECLDLARTELVRAIDAISRDGGWGAEATLIARLPPTERCADDARLALLGPLVSEADRDEAAAERAALDASLDARTSEQLLDAISAVEGVRDRVDSLGFVALQVEARDRLGVLLVRAGRREEAATAFEDAASTAIALGVESLGLQSLSRLVTISGYELAQSDRARAWSRVGKAIAGRVDPGGAGEAEMWNASGASLLREGAFAAAAEELRRADDLYAAIFSDHPARVRTLQNIAAAQFWTDGPAAANATYDRAIELGEGLYGPEHPMLAPALLNRAQTRSRAADYEGALDDLQRARALYEEQGGPDAPDLAAVWAALASTENDLGHHDQALSAIDTALEMEQRIRGSATIDAAQFTVTRAEILVALGRLDEARAAYEASIATQTALLGADHPETRISQEGLAAIVTPRAESRPR